MFLLSFLVIPDKNIRLIEQEFFRNYSKYVLDIVQQFSIIFKDVSSCMSNPSSVYFIISTRSSNIFSLVPVGKVTTFTLWPLIGHC